jgi:hypothetical protein
MSTVDISDTITIVYLFKPNFGDVDSAYMINFLALPDTQFEFYPCHNEAILKQFVKDVSMPKAQTNG